MIKVTRMNNQETVINSDLIKTVESTPDTIVTFVGGERMMIKESSEEVVNRVLQFKRLSRIFPE